MATIIRTGPYTFDDFCALIADHQKADLIDGVIYMASPENVDANDLFLWLASLMYHFAARRKLGRVFGSRVAFRLNDKEGPEPDIGFVLLIHVSRIKRGYVDGPPDLAVEIVSPESVERDYEKKRLQYQQAGVLEYWIVDQLEEKVTLLRLDSQGEYREVRPRKGILHSKVLKGFWLRPEWLWQDPLPVRSEILEKIVSNS